MGVPLPYNYKVKNILKIIDGDTFDCIIDLGFEVRLQARIRLAGLDAPESRTSDPQEKIFGLLSKSWLENHLRGNIMLTTDYDSDKGKYGRILGTVWVDGVNINEKMIAEHMAAPYLSNNSEQISAIHLQNRVILKEKGLV